MKRLLATLLVGFFVLPLCAFAENQEPFLFRNRYTWGMTLEEVKQQAAEEGLTLENEFSIGIIYQNVSVANITAKQLKFMGTPEFGLKEIQYTFTEDTEEALTLYPFFLGQLTLLYGEPTQIDSEAHIALWDREDTFIVLRGILSDTGCYLNYIWMYPESIPTPEPTPSIVATDGL